MSMFNIVRKFQFGQHQVVLETGRAARHKYSFNHNGWCNCIGSKVAAPTAKAGQDFPFNS